MKSKNGESETSFVPLHSMKNESLSINVLPLDHTNPYDYKRVHRHSYFEIILIENGGCNQLIDFIEYPGLDYSCYIICPQQIHLMNRNDSTGRVIQFTEDRINSNELIFLLKKNSTKINSAVIFENNRDLYQDVSSLINLLSKEEKKGNSTTHLVTTNLLLAFVSLIVSYITAKEEDEKEGGNNIVKFFQLLENHYTIGIGVSFFAERLGINEKKLSQLTKKHLGCTPLEVIHNRIVLEAKRLLIFDESPSKEIAYRLGFDSPSSFSAFMKLKTGCSPSQLRRRLAEIHK